MSTLSTAWLQRLAICRSDQSGVGLGGASSWELAAVVDANNATATVAVTPLLSQPAISLSSNGAVATLSNTNGVVDMNVGGSVALSISARYALTHRLCTVLLTSVCVFIRSGQVTIPLGVSAATLTTTGALQAGGLVVGSSGPLRPRLYSTSNDVILTVESVSGPTAQIDLLAGASKVQLRQSAGGHLRSSSKAIPLQVASNGVLPAVP